MAITHPFIVGYKLGDSRSCERDKSSLLCLNLMEYFIFLFKLAKLCREPLKAPKTRVYPHTVALSVFSNMSMSHMSRNRCSDILINIPAEVLWKLLDSLLLNEKQEAACKDGSVNTGA